MLIQISGHLICRPLGNIVSMGITKETEKRSSKTVDDPLKYNFPLAKFA